MKLLTCCFFGERPQLLKPRPSASTKRWSRRSTRWALWVEFHRFLNWWKCMAGTGDFKMQLKGFLKGIRHLIFEPIESDFFSFLACAPFTLWFSLKLIPDSKADHAVLPNLELAVCVGCLPRCYQGFHQGLPKIIPNAVGDMSWAYFFGRMVLFTFNCAWVRRVANASTCRWTKRQLVKIIVYDLPDTMLGGTTILPKSGPFL